MTLQLDFSPALSSVTVPLDEWQQIAPGDHVLIENTGTLPETGRIDSKTSDGNVIWVHLDHGRGRRMFLRQDGHRVKLLAAFVSRDEKHEQQPETD